MQGHPELSMAHVTVPDIRWVDWHALKAAGFKGCVFDKDNTLTEPYALGIHEPLTGSMEQCMDAFDGHVALLSNSAGLQEFDPKGKHVSLCLWQPTSAFLHTFPFHQLTLASYH
jgi:phosphatidylglycerophosphatase GEP4